jgi:hypothetical protein
LSFLIRKSPDQRLFASFPELIAGYNVLRRLSMPRHPPYTLSSLTTFIDHRHSSTDSLKPQGVTLKLQDSRSPIQRACWTEQTINNVSDRQKGARRYPLDSTDGKTAVGITAMQGESIATDIAEDHQSLSPTALDRRRWL